MKTSTWGFPAAAVSAALLMPFVSTGAARLRETPTSSQRSLIVNGETANPASFPFYVRAAGDGITYTSDLLCGASLIHSDIILTAAHCQGAFNYGAVVYNPSINAYNRLVDVDRQIVHPGYHEEPDYINFDLLVLRLVTPITDVATVTINSDPNFPVPRQDTVDAVGFGVTAYPEMTLPQSLQVGYFWALTESDCSSRGQFSNVRLGDDILCVDPVNDDSVCAGDSGGPLTVATTTSSGNVLDTTANVLSSQVMSPAIQVGITSFGFDCIGDNIPDGFTRVSYFYDWITQQICLLSQDPPPECSSILANVVDDSSATNAVNILLDFQHDFSAEETTFAVRNLVTNEISYAGPEYVPTRGEAVLSTFMLQPGNYAFEIYDKTGNGLQNPDYVDQSVPNGSWMLYADYGDGNRVALASGDANFQFQQTTQFRVNEPPNVVSTMSPTLSPPTPSPISVASPAASPTSPAWSPSSPGFSITAPPVLTDGGANASDIPGTSDSSSSSSWYTMWLPLWTIVGTMLLSVGLDGVR